MGKESRVQASNGPRDTIPMGEWDTQELYFQIQWRGWFDVED